MDIINNELFNQKNIIDEKADKFAKKEIELKDRSNDRSVLTSSMSNNKSVKFKELNNISEITEPKQQSSLEKLRSLSSKSMKNICPN
jgi:hypothetical protein